MEVRIAAQPSIRAKARVLVFGAGAIGSVFGHRLSQAGYDVTLVGRPEYVRAVCEHGLILEQGERVSVVHPRAVECVEDLPEGERVWDLMLLTVKAYDTQEAARALVPYASQGTPLLVVQNGVGGEELARQALGQVTILSGVITWPVSVLGPGHVAVRSTRGGVSLAPMQEGLNAEPWVELLTAAGVRTVLCRDYRAQKWSKLLLNMLANALPAILDLPPGTVLANPQLFAVERAAFFEALSVMHALRLQPVAFPDYPVPLLVWAMRTLPATVLHPLLRRLMASGRGEKKPSLQMDLSVGRQRSEVLYLNGAVVAYADRLGLEAPVNTALTNALLAIATRSAPWDEFRGQPDRLIAAIRSGKGGR